ncbi:TPA: hypothetical protein QB650_000464 [Pasteurella multocida]|uniref:hypothetical protein n=1 Tax=Pasteurella multocida TaxID=747 RepID=UPI003300F807|nr:hypothetical protein [Pasteurella multocida]
MALPKVTPVYQGTRRSALGSSVKPHYKGVLNGDSARRLTRNTARRKSAGGAGG